MNPSVSLTVRAQKGLLRAIETACLISPPFDPATDGPNHPPVTQFKAIWDTGATSSVITQQVIDACNLQPTGIAEVHGVHGKDFSETYLVNIVLQSGVGFPNIQVTKGKLTGVDVLIGMDIITRGDFVITNQGGNTICSFRTPSQTTIDFVQEENKRKQMASHVHGHSKKERKKRHKQFGKNKKR